MNDQSRPYALVTAGTSGLGLAICRRLVASGYFVLVHTRDRRAVAEALKSDVGHVHPVVADLSERTARSRFVDEVLSVAHTLDVVVHNLGTYPEVDLLDTSIELFEETLATTCTAAFHLTQLLLPALRRSSSTRKRIVTIGDSGADRIEARRLATPYHIAKVGLHILTRSYAQALGSDGITVNMISPGFLENSVGTPGTTLPMGRHGHFDDIVAALDFLLSEQASYVSGANLVVSGAWNLG